MASERLAAELAASLRRRGLDVPREPYQPAHEPYRRPPLAPPIGRAACDEPRLTDEDREDIVAMADAGVPWEEIEAEYPLVSTRGLKRIVHAAMIARRKAEGVEKVCVDCGGPVGRINTDRCPKCATLRRDEQRRARERQRYHQRKEAA